MFNVERPQKPLWKTWLQTRPTGWFDPNGRYIYIYRSSWSWDSDILTWWFYIKWDILTISINVKMLMGSFMAILSGWWLKNMSVSTILKNMNVNMGRMISLIYEMENNPNVPNHQPVMVNWVNCLNCPYSIKLIMWYIAIWCNMYI